MVYLEPVRMNMERMFMAKSKQLLKQQHDLNLRGER